MYLSLFSNLFVDANEEELFYLELNSFHSIDRKKLYQFNVNGQLMKIFYINSEKDPDGDFPSIHIKAKKGNRFYVIEDDKLILYKEASK